MTTRIQNLSDLQDRRIMMEKKLPAFGYALILLVAFLPPSRLRRQPPLIGGPLAWRKAHPPCQGRPY